MEKIQIDEYGEGNCCPVCRSVRINVLYQFPLQVEIDLKTRNERFYSYVNGEKVYNPKPSNRTIARRYKTSQADAQMWTFVCRKCGWTSDSFVP